MVGILSGLGSCILKTQAALGRVILIVRDHLTAACFSFMQVACHGSSTAYLYIKLIGRNTMFGTTYCYTPFDPTDRVLQAGFAAGLISGLYAGLVISFGGSKL